MSVRTTIAVWLPRFLVGYGLVGMTAIALCLGPRHAHGQSYSYEDVSALVAQTYSKRDRSLSLSRWDGRDVEEYRSESNIVELTRDGRPIAVFAERWISDTRRFVQSFVVTCAAVGKTEIHVLVRQDDQMGKVSLSPSREYQLLIRGFKGRNKTRIPAQVVEVFQVPELAYTYALVRANADLSEMMFKILKKATYLQIDLMDGNRPTNYGSYTTLAEPERHFAPFVRECTLSSGDEDRPTFRFGN